MRHDLCAECLESDTSFRNVQSAIKSGPVVTNPVSNEYIRVADTVPDSIFFRPTNGSVHSEWEYCTDCSVDKDTMLKATVAPKPVFQSAKKIPKDGQKTKFVKGGLVVALARGGR